MLVLGELLIQASLEEVLSELRYELNLNGNSYFSIIKDTGDNLMVTCPMHKNGQERKPSCGIHKQTGLVHCFTCGYTSQLPEMISNLFGYNDFGLFGANWLKKNFTEISVEERNPLDIDLSRRTLKKENYTYVPEMVLEQYRYTHPYVKNRGISDEIIDLFDIGYDFETDCVTFPVHDSYGNCLFVARRSVKDKYFNYPKGAEKPLYGFYEYRVAQHNNLNFDYSEVYICESMFNALSLWSIGKVAFALNGTGSYYQRILLESLPFRHIILALDNDDAGRSGANKIANALKHNKLVYTIDYTDERDINDLLCANQLDAVIATKHLYFS